VLSSLKVLIPILDHLKAAGKAAVVWWMGMSDAEKRTARGRAATVVGCIVAAIFAGQVIGERFDVQKHEEAFRADAAELNQSLAALEPPPASADEPEGGVRLVSFTNHISAETLGLRTSRDPKPRSMILDYADFNDDPERARDARTLSNLASWSSRTFTSAEAEQRELDCLAQAIYYEARSERLNGQVAVAEVVMNRVRDSRFPKTVCDVVYQGHERNTGCQFTFTCDGSLRHKAAGPAWDRARIVALHVSLGMSKPVTNNATHYHTNYVDPYWSPGMVETAEIGTHIFYRFPRNGAEWARARDALDVQRQHRDVLEALEAEAVPPPADEPAVAEALVAVAADKKGAEVVAPVAAVAISASIASAL
jgi:spore germination cell wall hydrolase CwlJ-like protein